MVVTQIYASTYAQTYIYTYISVALVNYLINKRVEVITFKFGFFLFPNGYNVTIFHLTEGSRPTNLPGK